MSDLTSELNLALAVDDDDTADYLAGTDQSLRSSLLVLDGQFNSSTGHAHNGAHQGGALQFLDLTVGEDLTVTGASDLHGSVHMYSNLVVDGTASAGATTLASLHVTGATTLDGPINSGNLTLSGTLNVGLDLIVGRNASVAGTFTAGAIGGSTVNITGGLTVGGGAAITGLLTAARLIVGGADYGHTLNTAGNGFAAGLWYQRAGAGRCWDNIDFTYGVGIAGNTLVQRDASGQIQAQSVYMPTAGQGGKPTYVVGQNNDGYMRWWPTNAIGPPISAWYAQANMTLPALSGGGGSADATFAAVTNVGGFTVSGTTITVPRPGWYSVAGGFNGSNNTGNSETMTVRLYAVGTQIDSLGVPIKISSFFGGYFSWEGFLSAGDYIHLNFTTSFDAISGSGEILVSFVPTAQYNN